MTGASKTWLGFGLCLAVVLGAMAWISLVVLRLERRQHEAQQQAAIEENIRLALWRMDSAAGALIAEENGRPYFAYRPFYPAERAYTRMYNTLDYGDVLIPSPLLTFESPHVLLHFQFGPDGQLSSPQAPVSNDRDLAEVKYTTHEKVVAATGRLSRLQQRLERSDLVAVLVPASGSPPASEFAPRPEREGARDMPQTQAPAQHQQVAQARRKTQAEFHSRLMGQQAIASRQAKATNTVLNVEAAAARVNQGMIQPVWVGDLLVLTRHVNVNGGQYIQGCWLDWQAIQSWLLAEVADLLPQARLEPVRSGSPTASARMLVSLPVRLVPGPVELAPLAGVSPLRLSLIIVWGCALAAVVAVAALLRSAIALGERRGAFVSAVTHELRTPLTTFRMYTDMLSRGMIPAGAQRQAYLDTLRREADRLSHLVGNVLAYARLEQGRNGAMVEPLALGPLLDRIAPRLAQRARDGGMTFDKTVADDAWSATVSAEPAGVEQILFNLVDNACKYAASAEDRTIELDARLETTAMRLQVCDHGPGLSRHARARLYQPFSKSAQVAANSAPGVGLGLALAQRYARDMGARLALAEDTAEGTRFTLTLPLAP